MSLHSKVTFSSSEFNDDKLKPNLEVNKQFVRMLIEKILTSESKV